MQLLNDLFESLEHSAFAEAVDDDAEARVLDVRTPREYRDGHIPGAENYDISDPRFPSWVQRLSREASYFVYCSSGARSLTACQLLATLGFTSVYNLRDGLIAWEGEIERSDEEELA